MLQKGVLQPRNEQVFWDVWFHSPEVSRFSEWLFGQMPVIFHVSFYNTKSTVKHHVIFKAFIFLEKK